MSKTQNERDKQVYLSCIHDGSFASLTAENLEKMEQIALKARAYPDHIDIKPTLDLTISLARTFRRWYHIDRALKRSENVQEELKELSKEMDAFGAKLRMACVCFPLRLPQFNDLEVYYARDDSRSRVLCQLRLYTPFMALFVAFGSFCSYLLEHPVRVIFVFILVLLILAFIFISIPDASITSVLHDSVIKLVRDVKALGETYKRIRVAVDTGDRATVDTILKDPGHLRLVNLSWRVHPSPLVEAPRMGKTSVERDTLLVPVLAYEFFIHPVYCAWELARGV